MSADLCVIELNDEILYRGEGIESHDEFHFFEDTYHSIVADIVKGVSFDKDEMRKKLYRDLTAPMPASEIRTVKEKDLLDITVFMLFVQDNDYMPGITREYYYDFKFADAHASDYANKEKNRINTGIGDRNISSKKFFIMNEGTCSNRFALETKIESLGGKVQSGTNPNSATDYFVIGNYYGSKGSKRDSKKLAEAENLFNASKKLHIITEEEFWTQTWESTPLKQEYSVTFSLTKEEAKGVWVTKKDAIGHLHISTYKGECEETLLVPSEIGGEKIDIVGLSSSYDMISKKRKSIIKRIIIGDGVKHIGRFAFAEMDNLQSIIIPPSVTYISPFAFYDTDIRGIAPIKEYSYADSVVDFIGEYTGQFPLEGRSICLIESDWDYRDPTGISTNDYKLWAAGIGAVFQPKPNSRTSLVVIQDDFCGISDRLDSVFELRKSGKAEVKAITEKKFWALFKTNNEKKNEEEFSSLAEEYARGISDKVKYIELEGSTFKGTTLTTAEQLFNYLESHGGILKEGNTNYVIIGDHIQDKTNTVIDAEIQKAKGSKIKALTESEFWQLVHAQEENPEKYEQYRQEEIEQDTIIEQERQRKLEEKRIQEERKIELAKERAAKEAEERNAIKVQHEIDTECDRIDQARADEKQKKEALKTTSSQQEEFMPVDLSCKPQYTPGNEPANIKRRLDILLPKLKEAYPDKKISSLQKEHKKWAETVTELYKLLGYPDGNTFLHAYGFMVIKNKAGRSNAFDPYQIIDELEKRYPYGSGFARIEELFATNPDLDGNTKTLMNKANDLFGMSLAKYLKYLGILGPVLKRSSDSLDRKEIVKEFDPNEVTKKETEQDIQYEEVKKVAEETAHKEEEAKKVAEEAARKEEKQRKRIEARKAEEARMQAEAEEKARREAAIRQYEQDHKQWEKDCEEVKAKRSAYVDEKIAAEKASLEAAATSKRDAAVSKANAELKEQADRKATAESTLASLGMFKFGEKKNQKAIIEDAAKRISDEQAALSSAESTYKSEMAEAGKKADNKDITFRNAASKEYPMPDEPKKPV